MIKRRLSQIVIVSVCFLAGVAQLNAQCVGPMSVPVLGSGTGLALSAGETHTNAACAASNGSATITATGGTAPYSGTGTFPQPVGTQQYTVTDAAGCTSTVTVTITVEDNVLPNITCPGPSPFTVTPNPGACSFTVGSEYNPTVSDNCGVSSTMYTTISGSVTPSSGSSLTGAVLGPGTSVIEWKVTDVNGNMNVCQFTVTVNPCVTIMGNLLWKGNGNGSGMPVTGTGVALATATLTGQASDTDGPTPAGPALTGGTYTLIANMGSSFTVTPTKHIYIPPSFTSLLNGLDAADATRLQQHLTNISPITDFYRLVAADCNKSYTISTVDAAIIRQALLLNPSALAILNNTKSWRFIPTEKNTPASLGYAPPTFSGLTLSLPVFPEKRELTGASGTVPDQDFYGVKVGDVYEVGSVADPASKGPQPEPLVWTVQDRVLQAGETADVLFKANNHVDLAAWQFALDFDPARLRYENVEAATTALPIDAAGNFGTYGVEAGELRVLWSVAQGLTLESGAPVFRVRFTALDNGVKLSEALGLDEKGMEKVAYTTDLRPAEVHLAFLDPVVTGVGDHADPEASGALLLQSRPNPFSDHTTIGFLLPDACDAQLRVFDVSGRELLRIDKSYPAGYHEEIIRLDGAAGVLYYELTTPFGTVSKKMVRVEK